MSKKIIAILANGNRINNNLLKKALSNASIIIAADGGAELCRYYSIKPDYIIGDLDSITKETRKIFANTKTIFEPDQNFTDLQKALRFACTLKPDRIVILFAFGKRIDHSICNMLIFQNYRENIPLEIYDSFGKMEILFPGKYDVIGKKGEIISLFSLEPIYNLSLIGFKYSIANKIFKKNFIGISNIFEKEKCQIQFDKGKLISYRVFKEDDISCQTTI